MNFDSLLHRTLAHGNEYNGLIPATTCQSTISANGNTDVSIQLMAEMIKEYSWQADKIAPLLQKSNLQQTVLSIKNFAYNHFQYKADDDLQNLRSLACSWYDRQNGIDCKSYSILSGSILSSLGITYYLRKIKQPGFMPSEFSHVYVIVPIDQTKGSLNQGYYTIDGTLKSNTECLFTQKNDLKMQHAKLNGATTEFNPDFQSLGQLGNHNKTEEIVLVDTNFEQGLNAGLGILPVAAIALKVLGPKLAGSFVGKAGLSALSELSGKVMSRVQQLAANPGQIFAYIGSIFSGCGAYGAWTEDEAAAFKVYLAQHTASVMEAINLTMYGEGFQNHEMEFAKAVAQARSFVTQLPATYTNILNDGWRSNCTIDNINEAINVTTALKNKTLADLTKYLDENFVIEKEDGAETWGGGIYFEEQVPGCRNRSSAVKYIYKIKPGIQLKTFPIANTPPIAVWDFSNDKFPNNTPAEQKAIEAGASASSVITASGDNLVPATQKAGISTPLILGIAGIALAAVAVTAFKKKNN